VVPRSRAIVALTILVQPAFTTQEEVSRLFVAREQPVAMDPDPPLGIDVVLEVRGVGGPMVTARGHP
jgi:hypothetical protein